jgi:prevent-host-death family protein
MSVAENMPLAEAKHHLSEVVDRLEREHGRVVITKNGRPAAVVLSVDDLESIEETLQVLGDAEVLANLHDALTGDRPAALIDRVAPPAVRIAAPVVSRGHLRLVTNQTN